MNATRQILEQNETYVEQLDSTSIATAIYMAKAEDFGRRIYLDLADGDVFTVDQSYAPRTDDTSVYIGKCCGEFGGNWECEARYETSIDEDGDETEGDFIGYTADGETFHDSREEAILAWINENGLDANEIDAILDLEVEVEDEE